ncbi:MAG: replication protein [Thermoproteota archaeon]|nr:MAG: replication protein [Candidatus Korarchaeota archaeon]
MSDNKKYYYLKLKDNYFDQDNIRVLEAQENGYIYSLIILKLYLKSVKHEGRLMMTEKIPYDPRRLDILARVLNHDVAHIKDALRLAQELDIIALMETGEIWMTDIQNFIGHSSTEADRKREYRKKIDGQMSRQLVDKYPPELEKELESESELEIKRERKKKPSPPKHKHGRYKRVLLTDDEYQKVQDESLLMYLDNLDEYIEMKGDKYKSHIATMRAWKRKDEPKAQPKKKVNYAEGW